jgi:hypothetical protein
VKVTLTKFIPKQISGTIISTTDFSNRSMNHDLFFSEDIHTMVFLVFSDPSDLEIYYKRQDKILNQFLERYKALLPWINFNNVELKFLTVKELLELCYNLELCHNSSNFMTNMLILNPSLINTITREQLKVIFNSLKLTILSLENHESTILNGILKTCFEPSLIPPGLLETCSEVPTLQYLQVENFEFPRILNLKETYLKDVIFNNVYFKVRTYVSMPLCLEKFHLNLNLQVCNDQTNIIGLWMNQCEHIKEL